MRWYLAFVGLTTIPIQTTSIGQARAIIVDDYQCRGITLAKNEVKVRRAKKTDAGWLRDAGADQVADALAG